MLSKNQKKVDSSSLVQKKPNQSLGETQGGSRNKPSAIIGMIFFGVIITWVLFEIENIPSQLKLLAWSSYQSNKISIIELETKQEFAKFNGVQVGEDGGIFQSLIPNSLTIH